jgi:hypothetical protein
MDLEPLSPDDPDGSLPAITADPRPERFSRRTKLAAAGVGVATVAAVSWVAGTSAGSDTPTVRIQPASAGSSFVPAAAGGTTSTTVEGHRGPRRPFAAGGFAAGAGGGGRAVIGTVSAKPGTSSFVVTPSGPRWTGHAPGPAGASAPGSTSGASGSTSGSSGSGSGASGSGKPSTPRPPVTVTVTASTTYSEITESKGPVTGLATGTSIVAFGTRNTDGSLQATGVSLLPAAPPGKPGTPGKTDPIPGSGRTSASSTTPGAHAATPPAGAKEAPIAFGTVAADTSAGVVTVDTRGGTETVDTGTSTVVEKLETVDFAAVAQNDSVAAVGKPGPTAGTLTAVHVTIIPTGTALPGGPAMAVGPGFGGPGFGFGRRPFRGGGPGRGPGTPGSTGSTGSSGSTGSAGPTGSGSSGGSSPTAGHSWNGSHAPPPGSPPV